MAKPKEEKKISVIEITEGVFQLYIVGKTPLILNRMSEKARQELLCPKGRKGAAEKAVTIKHDVIAEFRASAHTLKDSKAPTLLAIPAAAPKRAIATAALDLPGAKKAQIGRLCWVPGEYLPVYGKPQLLISTVRNSDMNHTPDQRTRVIVPHWACLLTINFAQPILSPEVVSRLLVAAGFYVGVGDWRNEKGAGNYGQFRVLTPEEAKKDEEVRLIMKDGRKVQEKAMANPDCYDDESADLLAHFLKEMELRGKKITKRDGYPEVEMAGRGLERLVASGNGAEA